MVLSLALGAADTDQRQAELWQQTSSPQPETAEPEDNELYLESHTRLADLVTDASWLLFSTAAAEPGSWLEQPVSAWEDDNRYRAFRDFVRDFK